MNELTENDRGTFLVTTYSGTQHEWYITEKDGDVYVNVTRKPKNDSEHHHWSMSGFPTTPYVATVKAWPVVGQCFLNVVNGGYGDIPWTRSSRVQKIERVS